MAMDGLSLGLMTRELQPLLEGRVDRVQQPDKDSVLLYCHGPNCGRVRLLLHIHNELGRVQLVEEAPENPAADRRVSQAIGRTTGIGGTETVFVHRRHGQRRALLFSPF